MSKKYTEESLKQKLLSVNQQYTKGEIQIISLLAKQKVKIKDKYGELITTTSILLRDQRPTIQSATNKTEYFKNLLLDFNEGYKNNELQILGEYIKNSVSIEVKTKYGHCLTTPSALLMNSCPDIRSAVDKTQYWINMAIECRGEGAFDYSLVEYTHSNRKIKIRCTKDQNTFEQLPKAHLRGNGCPYCANGGIMPSKQGSRKDYIVEYHAYYAMLSRCYNEKDDRFKNYGDRGIKVCDRWLHSFDHFIEDMGKKSDESLSLDRIDVNKGYEPTNCRWATKIEQANNKTSSRYITYLSQEMTVANFIKLINGSRKVYEKLNKCTPSEVAAEYIK